MHVPPPLGYSLASAVLGSSLSLTPVPCTRSVRWVTPNARSASSGVVRGYLRVAAACRPVELGWVLGCGVGVRRDPSPGRPARAPSARTWVPLPLLRWVRCLGKGGGDSFSLGSHFPALFLWALLACTWVVQWAALCSGLLPLCSLVGAGFLCPSAFRPLGGLLSVESGLELRGCFVPRRREVRPLSQGISAAFVPKAGFSPLCSRPLCS